VAAALQIWSHTFSKAFDGLPSGIRETVQRKIDDMGTRLENFPHQRLQIKQLRHVASVPSQDLDGR
jgi:hypothetical protein